RKQDKVIGDAILPRVVAHAAERLDGRCLKLILAVSRGEVGDQDAVELRVPIKHRIDGYLGDPRRIEPGRAIAMKQLTSGLQVIDVHLLNDRVGAQVLLEAEEELNLLLDVVAIDAAVQERDLGWQEIG